MTLDENWKMLWYTLQALAKDPDKNKALYEKVKTHPTFLVRLDKSSSR